MGLKMKNMRYRVTKSHPPMQDKSIYIQYSNLHKWRGLHYQYKRNKNI